MEIDKVLAAKATAKEELEVIIDIYYSMIDAGFSFF